MPNRKRLTVAEVADQLGVSPQQVRSLAQSGKLRGRQVEARGQLVWEFTSAEVERFVAARLERADVDRRLTRPAAELAS